MPRFLTRIVVTAALVTAVPFRAAADAPAQDGWPYRFEPMGLSSAQFEPVTVPADSSITASDGTRIRVQVYRPDTSDVPGWKTPVILVHSPYFDSSHSLHPLGVTTDEEDPIDPFVRRYTARGYTVVKSSMRGTGRSGGCFDNWGPKDASDFAELVDHFASRPWANGRVGAWGASAEGMTTNAALATTENLTTAVVMIAASGMYDTYAFDGVPYSVRHLTPTQQVAYMTLDAPTGSLTTSEVCTTYPEQAQADPRGTMTPYFEDREFRRGIERAKASVLYIANLRDNFILPIAIDGFYDQLPTFKKAVLYRADGHVFPWEVRVDLAREDWWEIFDAWLDQELLGLHAQVEEWPPVQVQDERNVWRAVDSYAAMGTTQATALGDGVIGQAGTAGTELSFSELGKPIVWDSAPQQQDLHLSGQASLELPITLLDRNDAHFAVALQEVRADGSVRRLTSGYRSAAHRESLTDPEPVPVGERIVYRIRTQPFDAWLTSGSRLRIVLGGNDDHTYWTSEEQLQVTGEPQSNGFTATVAVDGRAILHLPIANDTCGLDIRQTQEPRGAVPPCHASTWATWRR